MGEQLDLLGPTVRQKWEDFHERNPHVFRWLYAECKRAMELCKLHGIKRFGFRRVWEMVRWNYRIHTTEQVEGGFKLNNNYQRFYEDALIAHDPRLAGYVERRG
jgi:hypothetical protein